MAIAAEKEDSAFLLANKVEKPLTLVRVFAPAVVAMLMQRSITKRRVDILMG